MVRLWSFVRVSCAILVIACASLASLPAVAAEGGGCLGPFCYYYEQGCTYVPVVDETPIVMKGKVKKLSIRYGAAEWYGGTVLGAISGGGGGDFEQDWHIYFDESRCQLLPDGSCSKSIQSVGVLKSDEPTPFVEQMTLRKWKKVVDYDFYLVYIDKEVDWYYWSVDMTNSFLLKPNVMTDYVDTLGRGSTRNLTSEHTNLIGKEAMVRGTFVIDNPDDPGDHGHSEIHPMDAFAVLTDDRKEKGWTYRLTALTNSNLHIIGQCPFVKKAKTIKWDIRLPDVPKGKQVNINLSRLPPKYDDGLSGPVTAEIKTRTVNGKTFKVVRFKAPMKKPDKFGGFWVGDLSAAISDVKLKVATKSGFPKSLGYFDKNGATCSKCVTSSGASCGGNKAKKCRRRYEIAVKVTEVSLSSPTYKWFLEGKKKSGQTGATFSFTREVGKYKPAGNYLANVRVDAKGSTSTSGGTGSAYHTVGILAPQLSIAGPYVKLKKKTDEYLEYEWSVGAAGNKVLAKPRQVEWFHHDPPASAAWSALSTKPVAKGTITSANAKKTGYFKPLQVSIWDAYHAEVAKESFGVALPKLEVGVIVNYDAAKDGTNNGTSASAPFWVMPPYKYHTKWTLTAKSGMSLAKIPITWPVSYSWNVVSGANLLEGQKVGKDAFEITFKKEGVNLNDCVTVRLSASDQYAHEPSYDASICGGVTNEEAQALNTAAKDAWEELKQKMIEIMKGMKEVPILNMPPKPVDPLIQTKLELLTQLSAFNRSMSRAKVPLQPATLARAALMAPAVSKLAKLSPAFFETSTVIGKTFFWGSKAQKEALKGKKAMIPAATFKLYTEGFDKLNVAAIRGMFNLGLKPGAGGLKALDPTKMGPVPK